MLDDCYRRVLYGMDTHNAMLTVLLKLASSPHFATADCVSVQDAKHYLHLVPTSTASTLRPDLCKIIMQRCLQVHARCSVHALSKRCFATSCPIFDSIDTAKPGVSTKAATRGNASDTSVDQRTEKNAVRTMDRLASALRAKHAGGSTKLSRLRGGGNCSYASVIVYRLRDRHRLLGRQASSSRSVRPTGNVCDSVESYADRKKNVRLICRGQPTL